LARSGVRFANAYATSSWTGASVASIMTGLYPAVHGLETGTSVLASGLTTLAEEFRSAGYSTAAFSANPLFVVPEMGLAQGFERFDVLHGPPADYSKNIDAVPTEVGGQTMVQVAKADLLTDRALAWVTEPGRGRRPFFLYVHYFDPHGGYFPPHEYAARFGVAPDAPLAGAAQ
jgi:arylsulfatase A-like enzyme